MQDTASHGSQTSLGRLPAWVSCFDGPTAALQDVADRRGYVEESDLMAPKVGFGLPRMEVWLPPAYSSGKGAVLVVQPWDPQSMKTAVRLPLVSVRWQQAGGS